MLVMKIDTTMYPIIKVQAKERPIVPRLALNVLEFDPNPKTDVFLLYFREMEERLNR